MRERKIQMFDEAEAVKVARKSAEKLWQKFEAIKRR